MKPERYRHVELLQFAEQQARFAPVPVRLAQLERTENLLPTLSNDESYLYPDIIRAVTSRPTELHTELEMAGDDVVHDLLLVIEQLSESLHIDATNAPEPVLTLDQLAEKYHVTIKTIGRWRAKGLGGRRYRFGKRMRLAFPVSLVDRFMADRGTEISDRPQFTHLTDEEREWVIRRARRLARWGASQTQIIQRLAKRTGRAPETLRYTLKQHDVDVPTAAVLPNQRAPLSEDQRRKIYLAVKSGTSPTELAKQLGRTRSSIHRIAKEYRREQLLKLPLQCFKCPEFAHENAAEVILTPPPDLQLPELDPVASHSELPAYLSDLYAFPVLTRDQEYFLFRKMSYLIHQAQEARVRLPKFQPDVHSMNAIDDLLAASQSVKNVLIRCNLRLVVSVARKHQHDEASFFEMISDGNMVVIRAIETFDYTRGNKFSSYATWALMRHYARYRYTEFTRTDRFRASDEVGMDVFEDDRASVRAAEGHQFEQREKIEAILDQLNEREQEAISLRFGLGGHAQPMSLEEIADRLHVTKERARQTINSALEKLRDIAGDF